MASRLIALLIVNIALASAAVLNCPTAVTITDLANCIRNQMPQSGSNGYVIPTTTQRADYKTVVRAMLNGGCTGISIPASLSGIMSIRQFTDDKTYCVFQETGDSNGNGITDKGWDTFITANEPNMREIFHSAPHTAYDISTEVQAAEIFRGTNSRCLLIAGAHRNANSNGNCQYQDQGYASSDAAHNNDNMHQATLEEVDSWYGNTMYHHVQWHGMASSTCGDNVFCSHGYDALPGISHKCTDIKNSLKFYRPTWIVGTPGQSSCSLIASTNTQARFLNGVAASQVCGTSATSFSGQFISLEQDPNQRTSANWIATVIDVWNTGPPTNPTSLVATGGSRSIKLTWTGSVRVDSYTVLRATSCTGTFTVRASGVTAIPWTDTGLNRGQVFCYKVYATNEFGNSGESNTASGTAK
jgi:hypothetical protein